MNPTRGGARSLARLADRWLEATYIPSGNVGARRPARSICASCRLSIQRRQNASAAATAVAASDEAEREASSSQPPPAPDAHKPPVPRPAYRVQAGIVLSRPPVLTRDLTPFEKAFYLYQRRLNERLVLPFTRYFYYQKGTPGEEEWKRKIKERLTPARDIGRYNPYGNEGWNDELIVGAPESEPEYQIEALLNDAEPPVQSKSQVDTAESGETPPSVGGSIGTGSDLKKRAALEKPLPRVTEADRTNNQKSLDRALQRTLYLLVQGEGGRWSFPSASVVGNESLRQAAHRVLGEAAGVNMNTWIVGNAPIGHYVFDFPKPVENEEQGLIELGEKIFFMKGRIMSGQASLKETKLGLLDYRWLAKEEIKHMVTPKYWSMTQDMLVEQ